MNRRYSYPHVAMLKTSNEIFTNMLKYIADFLAVNTNLTEAYVLDMLARIDDGFTMLGFDNTSEQTASKSMLENTRVAFRKQLQTLMNSARLGLAKDLSKILQLEKTLDIIRLSKSTADEAVMELALNVLGSLESQNAVYTQAGIPASFLENLRTTATAYTELFKSQSSVIRRATTVSPENQDKLNEIYDAAVSVSLLARTIFSGEKAKLKLFVFSSIVKSYRVSSRKKKSKTENTTSDDFAQSIADAIAPIIEDKIEQEMN